MQSRVLKFDFDRGILGQCSGAILIGNDRRMFSYSGCYEGLKLKPSSRNCGFLFSNFRRTGATYGSLDNDNHFNFTELSDGTLLFSFGEDSENGALSAPARDSPPVRHKSSFQKRSPIPIRAKEASKEPPKTKRRGRTSKAEPAPTGDPVSSVSPVVLPARSPSNFRKRSPITKSTVSTNIKGQASADEGQVLPIIVQSRPRSNFKKRSPIPQKVTGDVAIEASSEPLSNGGPSAPLEDVKPAVKSKRGSKLTKKTAKAVKIDVSEAIEATSGTEAAPEAIPASPAGNLDSSATKEASVAAPARGRRKKTPGKTAVTPRRKKTEKLPIEVVVEASENLPTAAVESTINPTEITEEIAENLPVEAESKTVPEQSEAITVPETVETVEIANEGAVKAVEEEKPLAVKRDSPEVSADRTADLDEFLADREMLKYCTLVELRSIAKGRGLPRYSTLKKADLIELLVNSV